MNLPGKDQWRSHLILAVKVGVLGAALVVVTMITAYVTVRKSVSGRDVQVPDLTGLTVEEAAALLKSLKHFVQFGELHPHEGHLQHLLTGCIRR